MKYQHWRLANLLEVCDLLHTSDAPATSRPPYCFDVKQGTMWRRRRTSAAEWTFERFPPFVGLVIMVNTRLLLEKLTTHQFVASFLFIILGLSEWGRLTLEVVIVISWVNRRLVMD